MEGERPEVGQVWPCEKESARSTNDESVVRGQTGPGSGRAREKRLAVELATSSYRQFRPSMGLPVRITLGKPRFRLGYEYEEIRFLAPTPRIFRLEGEKFEREYKHRLDEIGVDRLRRIFEERARRCRTTRLVFLCFEDVLRGEYCHRRHFAAWWEAHTGEVVAELDPEDYRVQERLF
jgi:hypothetical protein